MKIIILFISLFFLQVVDANPLPAHPRLLMLAGEEEQILVRIQQDSTYRNLHELIIDECNQMLELPLLERKQIGFRLLAVSREAFRRIFYLSYSYLMTADERFFERAEREMLNVAAFTDWNPDHFLDVAEMTLGVSIGYDWLYNKLSDDSREIIRESIVQKGIMPSLIEKHNWFLEAKHNWNQVCNAGMLFGALAVYESDSDFFKSIIDRSINSIQLAMKDYGPDGAYPEGYSYWEYGTTFNVFFLSALEKVYKEDFGLKEIPGFMKTGAYYLHMIGLSGISFNYADCGNKIGSTPAMYWFANVNDDTSLLWNEMKYLQSSFNQQNVRSRFLPAIMIWGTDFNVKEPAGKMWSGSGTTPVALMRTSWTNPKGISVGVKGGTASSNHAHMDAGSFVMDANGVRWAMDFGLQEYQSLETHKLNIWSNEQDSERWKVFRYNNFSHNTITINDNYHQIAGYAPIVAHNDNPAFMFAVTDLTSVFEGDLISAKRGVAIVDESYVLVRDEVVSPENRHAKFRWTMLTSSSVKIKSRNRMLLYKDGEILELQVKSKLPVEMKTWSTQSPNDFDADNTGTCLIGFEAIVPAGEKASFNVVLLPKGSKYKKSNKIKSLDSWGGK